MLIECAHYLERHEQNPRNLSLFGQEKNLGTWAICKMNMLLHGLPDARIEKGAPWPPTHWSSSTRASPAEVKRSAVALAMTSTFGAASSARRCSLALTMARAARVFR